MQRWRVVSIVALALLAGVAAGFFVFPEQVNLRLAKLPGSPQVPVIPFRLGLDLQGGVHLVYEADLSRVDSADYDSATEGLRDIIERRVNIFGAKESVVQIEGGGDDRRLIVEIAGAVDAGEAIEMIGRAPFLEFRELKRDYEEIVQRNQQVLESGEDPPAGGFENIYVSTQLNGSFLQRAEVGFEQVTQSPNILLTFNDEGARLFQEITGRNVGKPLAIFLDNELLEEPVVRGEISGGKAQITGQFTLEEARQFVRDLNAGAVPVSISLLSQQTVGPTLGKVSLAQSLKAGIIGFFLVVAFMIAFYRVPGALAILTLSLYGVFLLFLLKIFGLTFTLAGIAGIILSIGMAVDANILIFSRFREEMDEGKSFSVSMEEGFRRAWPSIRDGNVTTLLAAFILFWFGTSFVQGFALTLAVGIFVSMFSAIFVTKNFMRLFINTRLEKIAWLWK
ncbi:MAG TPA: protein translocase subunit SecD [Candidatus Wildermuthbacteria bacterium]|nr:MAG: Preprotein translocase subunit SecD [Parcubacteria group bacterium GW2011_GWB1_49_12]OHA61184.1 MAG: protein-export membrane protein SecD [Candidatus Wildermuthbacteria bacterium GWA1_49_26]OHA65519.1 MAG: protein-export membrane protein SecD [Candidatus Wildermuthbacteria bacterium RIFCSPHIGHO2_01_FULL_50_47]OHA69374.1 MAG: protein-export membrane protein SecD [Candidatus Wildermuthbacteria bacterium RIFCSPHIGHO2_02_FULL_49_17]OHA71580.1 MAG: protein-export membrane protein SecD [Candi